jgi:hypothetical protein
MIRTVCAQGPPREAPAHRPRTGGVRTLCVKGVTPHTHNTHRRAPRGFAASRASIPAAPRPSPCGPYGPRGPRGSRSPCSPRGPRGPRSPCSPRNPRSPHRRPERPAGTPAACIPRHPTLPALFAQRGPSFAKADKILKATKGRPHPDVIVNSRKKPRYPQCGLSGAASDNLNPILRGGDLLPPTAATGAAPGDGQVAHVLGQPGRGCQRGAGARVTCLEGMPCNMPCNMP